MLPIDLTGRRALVAGVADDAGYGFAIAKALTEAGASVCVGTWPPALTIFMNLLERGKLDESRRLADGTTMSFERIYPLDAAFDTLADAPEETRTNKRYRDAGDFSIDGLVARLDRRFRLAVRRHRRALARERRRGEEATARDVAGRLPRRRERERLLAHLAREPPRAAAQA
jgi:hypothetical protein